jgi:hypothetical protein
MHRRRRGSSAALRPNGIASLPDAQVAVPVWRLDSKGLPMRREETSVSDAERSAATVILRAVAPGTTSLRVACAGLERAVQAVASQTVHEGCREPAQEDR